MLLLAGSATFIPSSCLSIIIATNMHDTWLCLLFLSDILTLRILLQWFARFITFDISWRLLLSTFVLTVPFNCHLV